MKKILMAMVVFAILFTAIVSARAGSYAACTNNPIANWNFEDSLTFVKTGPGGGGGNIGYFNGMISDYKALDPASTGSWTLGPEKYFTVSTNPNLYHSAWTSFGDHTTGTGKMMIINASPDSNKVIWEQTVTVQENTKYVFSYWIALAHPDNPPILKIFINGTEVGQYDTATSPPNGTTGLWVQVKHNWSSGAGTTSATIQFVDATVQAWGDDFVLDDIELCILTCAEVDLVAGRGNAASAGDVGEVSVKYIGGQLYVTYTVEAPWCFTELHLAVFSDFAGITTKNGNPIPGQFPYKYYPEGGACENTYTFPPIPAAICPVNIAAHAAVQKQIDGGLFQYETAWGDGTRFTDKGNWGMYFNANDCVPACTSP